jgi:3',5'-cyclic AMP phosphodiesterase CpdA
MSSPLADIFLRAAQRNTADTLRDGSVVRLPACEVVIAGDIHGNRNNLNRIIAYADLGKQVGRRLILQELIHGPPDERTGQDRSIECLLRAARLKLEHPAQVYFLMGNHDIAQATGKEITKNGQGVCEAFARGVSHACGGAGAEVLAAAVKFLLSQPMAVRCPGRVLAVHSLPHPSRGQFAGEQVPAEPFAEADLLRGGRVYEWLWGRDQNAEQVDRLAKANDADLFVLGHQPCEPGWAVLSERAILVDSQHERGAVLHLNGKPLTVREVQRRVMPIAGLAGRSGPYGNGSDTGRH